MNDETAENRVAAAPDETGGPDKTAGPDETAGTVEAAVPDEAGRPIKLGGPTEVARQTEAGQPVEATPVRSTELVPAGRRLEVVAPGRLAKLVTGVRGRVLQLSRHPAAVASVSAATTIGGALLVNALRQAGRAAVARTPAGPGRPMVGYVLHEVHVFHHVVVHHAVRPPDNPAPVSGHRPRPPTK